MKRFSTYWSLYTTSFFLLASLCNVFQSCWRLSATYFSSAGVSMQRISVLLASLCNVFQFCLRLYATYFSPTGVSMQRISVLLASLCNVFQSCLRLYATYFSPAGVAYIKLICRIMSFKIDDVHAHIGKLRIFECLRKCFIIDFTS
jgi:hypothetical protein